MANSTLTPNTKDEQDAYGDPTVTKQGLSEQEKQAARDTFLTDQMEAAEADRSKSVKEQENSINYDPTGSNKRNTKSKITAKNILKRGGPAGLITGVLAGAIGFVTSFAPLLPVHLLQSVLSKYDSNNTSHTIRSDKMIVNKLLGDGTEGDCTLTKVLCKFSRPSNYMLKSLDANGLTPLDANKQPIDKRLLGPNKRPRYYAFTDSTGKTIQVDAKNLKTTLSSNDEFRAAFHGALKTRLQVFSDSIFKSVADRFGFSKKDSLATAKTEEEVNTTVKDEASGTTAAADGTSTPKTAGVDEIKQDIGTEAKSETGKLGKSAMGDAVGLAAGGLCLVGDVPGIVTRTARVYQMAQLIRFGALFMTTVSALKAGKATPVEVAATTNSLTKLVNGKSALDSFGLKYTLFGDTSPAKGSKFKNYVPGGAVMALFGPAIAILDSHAKKDVCSMATSPLTGAAIDVAIGPETLGLGTLANVGVGFLIGLGIQALAPTVIDLVLSAIPPQVYQDLLLSAFGDITKGLEGENYGDALASGAANTLGQLSNAGGNIPLSVDQAVAYDAKTQEVNLAYAKEDQATLNPLDASNSNTMMGAFFDKLIPLYSQMGSLTSIISSVGSIASTSTANLLIGNTYAATTDAQQYKLCDDPALTDPNGKQVAAGPFCNIQYGIPTQYLNMDPQQVASDLLAAGQIDPNTGEAVDGASPVSIAKNIASQLGVPADAIGGTINYYDWLQMCTDGKSDQASNCKVTDDASGKTMAEYAIYTIDHRIQKDIDDEDTAPASSTSTTTSDISGTKAELAKAILASGKVSFLDGVNSSSAARKQVLSDIATGKTDGNSLTCGLNIKVLQVIKAVVDKHSSVMIGDTNSLCTGATQGRWPGSRHIGGNGSAIDFNSIDGTPLDGFNAASISLLKEIKPYLSTGTNISQQSQVGQKECRPYLNLGNVAQIDDACTHVHVDFPVSDDPSLKTTNGAY